MYEVYDDDVSFHSGFNFKNIYLPGTPLYKILWCVRKSGKMKCQKNCMKWLLSSHLVEIFFMFLVLLSSKQFPSLFFIYLLHYCVVSQCYLSTVKVILIPTKFFVVIVFVFIQSFSVL